MFSILTLLFNSIFNLFKPKKSLLIRIALQQKEIEILRRKNQKKRFRFSNTDRLVISILYRIGQIKDHLSLVKPETVLQWQKRLIQHFWTFKSSKRNGRPPIDKDIKQLILNMKNDNLYWGCKKIQGELLKLGISLDKKTIRNILDDFRRQGKVRKSLTWKQFLSIQAHSLYAMDFFTVDTILNHRFYIFFIIHHQSREIVQFALTRNPCREFVRQQMIEFGNNFSNLVYLIHDNAPQFELAYRAFGIKAIRTSVNSPNMNSIAERFVKSARCEALDYFLFFSESQIRSILEEYIQYYNSLRPHQGINQDIPRGFKPRNHGKVLKTSILGGLCYHYERRAA